MAEHFNAMLVGAHSIGELPIQGHCTDAEVAPPCVQGRGQACTKCLDMRVLDGDLVIPTCV